MAFYYAILEKRSYTRKDTRLHTLISYVLLAIATVYVCIYVCTFEITVSLYQHSSSNYIYIIEPHNCKGKATILHVIMDHTPTSQATAPHHKPHPHNTNHTSHTSYTRHAHKPHSSYEHDQIHCYTHENKPCPKVKQTHTKENTLKQTQAPVTGINFCIYDWHKEVHAG